MLTVIDLNKWWKQYLWRKAVRAKFGFDPEHLTIQHNLWTFATWREDEVPHIIEAQRKADEDPSRAIGDGTKLNYNLDKIFREIANTTRNTVIKPIKLQVINGMLIPRILTYQERNNILTNPGMAEMGKRSTAEVATTNTHHAIGTGVTSETINDTALQTEVGRKVIGTRAVVNQTERYGTAFVSTDVTPPKTITEAGVLTASAGGVLILRVTAAGQLLDTALIVTVQTNVTHINGTET